MLQQIIVGRLKTPSRIVLLLIGYAAAISEDVEFAVSSTLNRGQPTVEHILWYDEWRRVVLVTFAVKMGQAYARSIELEQYKLFFSVATSNQHH
ncbi:uncharacterized protein BDR25DRAFT_349055 [Lindgomyces ingoldianus]|uniref:Uncharacterized protein n=1 Tax=Lindgomyces ingoldianus TaxID=673940 RepID=A0ACB6RFA9_9PLEO|nr:uncharacterized protein BDR25DRAFT_349055 [Lindgomyces ingoldianus]KAF2477156.1 hypothetical protein BDR25DRAFT_349055 [Lindgomyces ingoldianus]